MRLELLAYAVFGVRECREQAKRLLRSEDRDALERVAQLWEKLAYVCERAPEAKEQRYSSRSPADGD
jgi:hypothetical protein